MSASMGKSPEDETDITDQDTKPKNVCIIVNEFELAHGDKFIVEREDTSPAPIRHDGTRANEESYQITIQKKGHEETKQLRIRYSSVGLHLIHSPGEHKTGRLWISDTTQYAITLVGDSNSLQELFDTLTVCIQPTSPHSIPTDEFLSVR
jgi:hypothetical protein